MEVEQIKKKIISHSTQYGPKFILYFLHEFNDNNIINLKDYIVSTEKSSIWKRISFDLSRLQLAEIGKLSKLIERYKN